MSANGKLQGYELSPIAGGQLRNDAAKAWNAFARHCKVRHGVVLSVNDSYRKLGAPGDYAAGRWSQWAAWERYQQGGNLAARPGSSNHGLGLAIDVPPATQNAIRQWGAAFGWSKAWSDAAGEPWHFKWSKANATQSVINRWSEVQAGDAVKYGDKGPGVRTLKVLLRRKKFWPHPLSSKFGRTTQWWLKRFQKSRGLKADGIAGPATWKALRRK